MNKNDLYNDLVNKIESLINVSNTTEEKATLLRMRLNTLDAWHTYRLSS